MRKLSTISRLSLGLVALTLSVLSSAQLIGVYPDKTKAVIEGRLELCKAIGMHCAAAVQEEINTHALRLFIISLVEQNKQILSAGVRTSDGHLLMYSGDHPGHWAGADPKRSTATHMRVSIIRGDELWGAAEISFASLRKPGLMGLFTDPLIGMMLFVGAAGYLAYMFYLRRTLKMLNPQAVIPERVQAMLNALAEGVVVIDKNRQIMLANQAFADSLNLTAQQLQGKKLSDLGWGIPERIEDQDASDEPNDPANIEFPWLATLQDGAVKVGVPLKLAISKKDVRTLMVNAAPITGGEGDTRGALVTFDDVTAVEEKNVQLNELVNMLKQSRDQISKQNEELQWMATRDPLTGCFNRRSLFEQFDALWRMADQSKKDLGCILFDIDHFKSVNDNHGHAVGDQVLREVAEVVQKTADEMDLVCRYGGEEFCVLMRHANVEQAASTAERIREAIEQKHCAGLDVTSSFGVSSKALGAASPQDLIEQADQALYAAKHGGRNQVVRWDQMPEPAKEKETPPQDQAQAEPEPQATTVPFQAVTGLLAALTHRDPATGQHSKQVADLCVMVGKDLMKPRDCFVLEVAALLHDIGKLGVPDALLHKDEPLTDEEHNLMRFYHTMGVAIVKSTFASPELAQVLQTYHAWYGGNPQTPDLPTGDAIPTKARILAIADAFDAMVYDRHQQPAMSHPDAIEALRSDAGTRFDPELVERFAAALDKHHGEQAQRVDESSRQLMRQLGQTIDRLTSAFEQQDFDALPMIAAQLRFAAVRGGSEKLGALAGELEKAALSKSGLEKITQLTQDLLDLCQSMRHPEDTPTTGPPSPSQPSTGEPTTPSPAEPEG